MIKLNCRKLLANILNKRFKNFILIKLNFAKLYIQIFKNLKTE